MIDLVAQAQRSYWDLVFAAEDIKVKQRSVDLAQKTLSDNQIQVQIGTLAPIDLVQAESEVANRHVQFVTSTYTRNPDARSGEKAADIPGRSGNGYWRSSLPVQGVRTPDPSDVLPVDEAIKMALENRPEMKQIQLDLENKKIDYEYTKNQLLPTVDLMASYTQTGVAGTKATAVRSIVRFGPATVNPDLIGGLGTAFGQVFSYNYTGYSAGISVQIPLRNRAAQADNARAATEQANRGESHSRPSAADCAGSAQRADAGRDE